MTTLSRFVISLTALVACGLRYSPGSATAAPSPGRAAVSVHASPAGLALSVSPGVADVGDDVTFTLTATAWSGPASVSLSFVSAHHGFRGAMQWEGSCSCFRLAVALAQRIHPLELAKAAATVKSGTRTAVATASFLIRGLAPDGKSLAPGGPPHLSAWASDPAPLQNEYEHICAWVTTEDGLGVPGMAVKLVVHFAGGTQRWTGKPTNTAGLSCVHRPIGKQPAGKPVRVDVYAGSLHTRVSFTPQGS